MTTNQNPIRRDPTRTALLRRKFAAEINRRFNRLRVKLIDLIEREDAFGFAPRSRNPFVGNVYCPTGEGGGIDPTCSPRNSTSHVSPQGVSYIISGPLTKAQTEVVKATFEKMPAALQRSTKGIHYSPAGGTYARPGHYVAVGKSLGEPEARLSVYLHEAGHMLMAEYSSHPDVKSWDSVRKQDESPEGWTEYTKIGTEDFAESVRYYVSGKAPAGGKYEGKTFREAFPKRAEVLDKLFNDEPTANTRWRFLTSTQQLDAFKQWLGAQVHADILGAETDQNWLERYIQAGWERGRQRAFEDTRPKGADEPLDFYRGTRSEFLQSAFGRPVSVERVKLLASRAYDDLRGITQAMSLALGRELVDGMIRGESPRTVARAIAKQVDGIGRKRALTMARTETIRAHAEGQLDSLEKMGVEKVGVAVEWSTSDIGYTKLGNPSPCKLCAPLRGIVLTLEEAHGLIPRHPNCMCSFIPANVGEKQEAQKRTKARIQKAIRASVKAEIPKKSKRPIEQQRKISKWLGAGKRITKNRPKGIV